MNQFVHLHVHSRASILDASSSVEDLAEAAAKLGMPAIALTDHNNVFNALSFYKACNKNNVKPILGIELNIVDDCAESIQLKLKDSYHIILLAENNTGWKNIVKLLNIANDEQHFYYTPRIDLKLLEQHKEGVIVLTSCHNGILGAHIKESAAGQFKAEAIIRRCLQFLDKDHFYIEVQDAKDPTYIKVNDLLRKMAMKYGLKTVATTDVHYVAAQDAEAHQTLRKMSEMQHSKTSGSEFNTDEYYLKSREEVDQLSFTEGEKNLTLEIANRCNVNIDFKRNRLPSYPYTPAGKTGIQYLRELVYDKKYQWSQDYKDRLEKELGDIEKLGFSDYFLLVADVVNWAKNQGILTGPGRGSVGGSLVSYALGITNIDPLVHGLIWERFLNAGRKSLPDIDSDFQRSRRGEVIAYIKERFGNNKVTQLVTFNKLAARAVLKEVFRAYGMPFEEANKITALLPFKNEEHTQITLDEAIKMVPELQQYEKKYKAWFSIARSLEGCYKSIGTHASAVVISDKDFSEGEYPLCRSSDNKSLVFAWDMQNVDDLGLLKLDVLGLSTLDVLSDVMELVRQRHNKSITLNDIKLDDVPTYNLLGDGKTIGIFQLEKQLGKTWSKQLTPKSISEISDLISIIRPGPLESGMHEEYKLVKENQKLPHYVHRSLKPILDTTYGALLYQEQVIEICKQLSGMSLIDADLVRKAMGKKKPEEMKKWKDVFINGCKARSIPEDAATEIWSYIDKFSGYGFNKSHGIGYALTAYYTAYFKANYPIEFFCANLKNTHFAQDTFEDINQFVHDARLFGFDVIPPKLMYGNPDFNIIDNKQIVFGLSFLKGIGDKGIATAKIAYQNNQTADFDGFLHSAEKHSVNRRIMESLILGGALDSYNESRTQMLAKYNLFDALTDNEKNIIITHPTHNWINIVRAMADDARAEDMKKTWNVKIPNSRRRETLSEAVVAFDGANPFDSEVDKVSWEKEFLGISLSGDETRVFRSPNTCSDVVNYGAAEMTINVAARVEKVKKHLTKTKQQEMAFLTIADHTAKIDNVVIFPFQWSAYKDSVFEGNIVRVKGRIDDRGSLIVNYLERLR